MKKYSWLFLLVAVLAGGCGKNNQPPSTAASPGRPPFEGGRKTSFQEVTSQLDPGGSLYLYLATDQWLDGLSKKVIDLRGVFATFARPSQDERELIDRAFTSSAALIRQCGLEEITGVGLSAAPVADGLYRNKMILHHASGGGKGFLWSAFGPAPHALAAPDLLPSTTALAFFADLDIKSLWTVLQRHLQQTGIPPAEEFATRLPAEFEKETGLVLSQLLDSFDGEVGFILTLDPDQPASLPMGGPRGPRLNLPGPGLLAAVKVKSDYLYDQLSAKMKENPRAVSSEAGGLKLCSMDLPNPMQLPLQPTLASGGGYFYFATSPELVRTVQKVRAGQTKGLKADPEFQSLARHLPAQGNQFVYVSRSFGETLANIQRQAMSGTGLGDREWTVLQQLIGAGQPTFSLSIGAHTATGWQTTTVGNQDNVAALLLAPVGVTAIGAGLLLPAMAKAKGRAQTMNSINNLKQLALSAHLYADEKGGKLPPAATWCDALNPYVAAPQVYKAPNDPSPERCSYAFNAKLSGRSISELAGDTVLFFEAEATWNTSGGQDLHLSKPRGGTTYAVAFVDGSVRMVNPNIVPTLHWDP